MSPTKLSVLLLAGLGLPGLALGDEYVVGDSICVVDGDCDFTRLSDAIYAAADGDVITIRGDLYNNNSDCSLPHISNSITIQSDVDTSGVRPRIKAIRTSAETLGLYGLVIEGGEGWYYGNSGFDYQGSLVAEGTEVVGDNILMQTGSTYSPDTTSVAGGCQVLSYYQGGDGAELRDGASLDLSDFEIRGFWDSGIWLQDADYLALDGGEVGQNDDDGIHIRRADRFSLTDVVVNYNDERGIVAEESPFGFDGEIHGGTIDHNNSGGIYIDWGYPIFQEDSVRRLTVVGTEFFQNRYSKESDGSDISWHPEFGTLSVQDAYFTEWDSRGGSVAVFGGDARFADCFWERGSDEGIAGFDREEGGAVYATNSTLTISGSLFLETQAERGGAIYLDNDFYEPYIVPMEVPIDETEFVGTYADSFGGAIYAETGTDLEVYDSDFFGTRAYLNGGAVHFGNDFFMDRVGASGHFGELTMRGVAFDGAEGGEAGGAIYIGDEYQRAWISGSFTEVRAGYNSDRQASGEGEGWGGAIAIESGNSLTVVDSTFDNVFAQDVGGVIASFPRSGYPYRPGYMPDCADLEIPNLQGVYETPAGSAIDISGSTVTDGGAYYAGFGLFGPYDEVRLTENEIIGMSAYTSGMILGIDVTSMDLSCNTFCGNEVSYTPSMVYLWDSGQTPYERQAQGPGGPTGTRAVAYSITNNVFQEQSGDEHSFAVQFELCDAGYDVPPPVPARVQGFGDSEDTGAPVPTPRGLLKIQNNTFVGPRNTGGGSQPVGLPAEPWGGLLRGRAEDVRVDITNNIFQSSGLGIEIVNSPWVDGDYNLYGNDITRVFSRDADLFFPGDNDLRADAVYVDYVPGECDSFFGLDELSPGLNQGDPRLSDFDDSRSDMGVYGGPRACIPDRDDDGTNRYDDCDDDNPTTYPGAGEVPYNQLDEDCDGEDLCDVDGDSFDSTHGNCLGADCNDANPDWNPGIVESDFGLELYADGHDQDCDGDDFCDFDDDGFFAAEAPCGGTDCEDMDDDIHPGAADVPYNGIAEDCVSDVCDVDADGHEATAANTAGHCEGADCDDSDPNVGPGATEVPYDGIDNDCANGDECDVDNDGFIAVECGGNDCDDRDPDVHPGAPDEPDDGVDSDCDGDCDLDQDGDRSAECDGGTDCNDTDAAINSEAAEIPYDGIDQDCDGADLCDVDGDGFDAEEELCGGFDCDDEVATINPDRPEIPGDGIDQDCVDDDVIRWLQGGCNCDGKDPTDCSTSGGPPTGAVWAFAMGLALWRRRRNGGSPSANEVS